MQVLIPCKFIARNQTALVIAQMTQSGDSAIRELFCPADRTLPELASGAPILVEAHIGQKPRQGGGYKRYFTLVTGVRTA